MMYTPENILVTGGGGFIASNTVRFMMGLYPNYNIVVLDKFDYCASMKNLSDLDKNHLTIVKGDIKSSDLVNDLLVRHKIDTVMHFAAQTHVDTSFDNSLIFTENNIVGTHVLLEAALQTGTIKRFIHVSTDEVYGENNHMSPSDGHADTYPTKMNPSNPYAATKEGFICPENEFIHSLNRTQIRI